MTFRCDDSFLLDDSPSPSSDENYLKIIFHCKNIILIEETIFICFNALNLVIVILVEGSTKILEQ